MFRRTQQQLSFSASAQKPRYFSSASFVAGFGIAASATLTFWIRRTKSSEDDVALCHEKPATPKITPHEVHKDLPVLACPMSLAPNVPPPITRRFPALLRCDLQYDSFIGQLTRQFKFNYWTISPFGTAASDLQKCCPGPFIRCRVGDVIEVNVTNPDVEEAVAHNIDFHAFDGPGGGAPLLLANPGESKSAHFKVQSPGLFIYHCAAAPIPMHIANGMYGLLLVEPEGGLPIVDKEYYIMQSEFYFDLPDKSADDKKRVWIAYDEGLNENATAVVFNGRQDSLTKENALRCKVGDRVRLFVGNAGPNLASAFHVIGALFDTVYREGDLLSPPARCIQTTMIPPGCASVVEMQLRTAGNYTLIDHSIFRLDKGCVGYLYAQGEDNPEVCHSNKAPSYCPGCGVHP